MFPTWPYKSSPTLPITTIKIHPNIPLPKKKSNGADFEFLPVTVNTNHATLNAVLRVGVRAGIAFKTPHIDLPFPFNLVTDVGVIAHVAELVTYITPATPDNNCDFAAVQQEYTLAVGAAAGASVHVRSGTWGPQVTATTAVYFMTLGDDCAVSATATATALVGRQDLATTTTTTNVTYAAISCLSTGLINCPVSAQKTMVTEMELTLSTAVPSGGWVDWDSVAVAVDSVTKTVAFGTGSRVLSATCGAPSAFIPSETAGFGVIGSCGDVEVGSYDNIAVAVGVGVGVPLFCWACRGCLDITLGGLQARNVVSIEFVC